MKRKESKMRQTISTLHRNKLADLYDRAERVKRMIMDRARQAARESGLHETSQLHNAFVSYDDGRPWKGVDYAKARKARWLVEKSFRPMRLVYAYHDRKTQEHYEQTGSYNYRGWYDK